MLDAIIIIIIILTWHGESNPTCVPVHLCACVVEWRKEYIIVKCKTLQRMNIFITLIIKIS